MQITLQGCLLQMARKGLCEEATLSGDVVLEKDHQYFIDHEIFFQDKHAEALR